MTVRETSVEAYYEVLNSGYIGRRQKEVYTALADYGPCTAGELFYKLTTFGRNPSHSNISTRLGELRDYFGIVDELPKRVCSRSGVNALVWQVNANRPTKPEKKIKKIDERIQRAVIAERLQCAEIAESWEVPAIAIAIRNRI
jgi:hypothetical protein